MSYNKSNKVVISNNILRSDYLLNPTLELSLQQKRFVYYLISLVKKTDRDFYDQEISIADYCELFGLDKYTSRNRSILRNSLAELGKKVFWFKPDPTQDAEELLRWLDKIRIDYSRGVIQVRLGAGLKEFLLQLTSNYSSWELGYTAKFKCTYSFSLYHLFTKWIMDFKSKTFYISVEDLREYLLQGRDLYPRWADFKKRCVDPAVEEINAYTNYDVTYETDRTGENGKNTKQITNICFTITKKQGEALERVSEWKKDKYASRRYLVMSDKVKDVERRQAEKQNDLVDTPDFEGESYEDILFDEDILSDENKN